MQAYRLKARKTWQCEMRFTYSQRPFQGREEVGQFGDLACDKKTRSKLRKLNFSPFRPVAMETSILSNAAEIKSFGCDIRGPSITQSSDAILDFFTLFFSAHI